MTRSSLVPQSVPDDAYNATTWNGSTEVPTKNAVRDKIESMGGGGDVVGPASSTNNAVPLYDGTTGKLIKNSTLVYTSNNLSGVGFIGGAAVPASDFVGTSDTQVVTNKNLTSGTNTFPTFNQSTTGSAATLTTARNIQTNLASTSAASFNGSANITPGVTGTLPVGNGGTGATSLATITVGSATTTTIARQNSTTNTTVTSARTETGWGYMLGNATAFMTKAITFGTAFGTAPVVTVNFAGYNSVVPTTNANLQDNQPYMFSGQGISTTGFTVNMARPSGTFANTLYYIYNWTATGA